ncbi:MAG: UDP-N-acetylglucosamine 1-carboxyvinyltransferase [Waddliaceae bacterium]|nr:UDP-N-acetylglucosamine 1-carboxyvinyltransferase [Waddliaceae bacterium]
MEALRIHGGTALQGTVRAAGAKNAITKLIVASLLSDKRSIFYNVPNISEVEVTLGFCEEIGMDVQWDKDAGILEVITKELKTTYIPQKYSGANRIPILMIGALLGRTDQDIIVPTVGGCSIGARSLNFHIMALEKLGAQIEYRGMKREGAYFAQAHHGLKGSLIELPYPSVGATENSILAAVRAKGTTLIRNAAMEPEIIDLILYLQKLGANITVDVDRSIHIEGATDFYEVEHHVITDRIEAASFGLAAITSGGRVFVEGAQHEHMITFLNKLRDAGGCFKVQANGIEFFREGPLDGGLHLETDVHPGFLTDWQQPFVVMLTQAQKSSVIHETVYENRFGYIETLNLMGAKIDTFNQCLGGTNCRFASQDYAHSIVVRSPTPLYGQNISIPDLRAGFAYVMAGLIAEGVTTICGLHYLDRGYENIADKLQKLGAEVERVPLTSLPEVEPELSKLQTIENSAEVQVP